MDQNVLNKILKSEDKRSLIKITQMKQQREHKELLKLKTEILIIN